MQPSTYSVVPVPGGWSVEQPCGGPLMFLSGGRAEAKAKQLAEQAAARGLRAEVIIFDRNKKLLVRRRYPEQPTSGSTFGAEGPGPSAA